MKQTKEIKRYENERFGQERALYMTRSALIRNCRFEGEEDGESALKESRYLTVEYCLFDLRYPFWHVEGLHLRDSEMTPNCRAALWYDRDITIERCNLHGIKAVRECKNVSLRDCDIDSPEFGWHSKNVHLSGGKVTSEYAFLGSDGVQLDGVDFRGKYSFQYAKGVRLKNCVLNTKDAFWHTKGARAEDCIINGEYLGWYSEGLTLVRCHIKGTQPLCYCKDLTLIDCTMEGCDLAFEYSDVHATVKSTIDSVKNPRSGRIEAQGFGEVIEGNSVYPVRCKLVTKK